MKVPHHNVVEGSGQAMVRVEPDLRFRPLGHECYEPTPAATLSLGPTASRVLANANSIFVETTTVAFVIPAIIWLAVTLTAGVWPFASAGQRDRKISSA
jgi:hypothetical protein